MMRIYAAAVLCAAAVALPMQGVAQFEGGDPLSTINENAPPVESLPGVTVTLRGIDKLSGEVATREAKVGASVMMWRLEVKAPACFRRPEQRAPESSAFLQVFDTKYKPATRVFSGWMFASSPALSAMDHPRYDIWVLSCNIASPESSG